jgi:hypothetical protein
MIRLGEKSQAEIAELFNVDRSTISRMMKEVGSHYASHDRMKLDERWACWIWRKACVPSHLPGM